MEEIKEISVKENIEILSQKIQELQSLGRDYKKTVESTKGEVGGMDIKLELMLEDTPKSFMPQIEEIFNDLKSEVQHQKSMNEFLQKQVTELKKERSILGQHVIANNTSVSLLQERVGYTSKF